MVQFQINLWRNTITNAVLKVDTKDNAIVYSFVVDDIQNKQIQLPHTSITGKSTKNIVDYTVAIKDAKDKERYLIAGTLKLPTKQRYQS
jgi:hypothetical protein